ncbi:MAG TPA: transcription elongation factor, partial [Methylophaga sp.]|nr:transcription elongation factor [Methylophaga sp.]
MNKSLLLKHIVEKLDAIHQGAINAAMQAYNTATHEENVAENKYDTLGLGAAYLAQGQSQRVAECEADLTEFKKLPATVFSSYSPIDIDALVCLKDELGASQTLFLGPAAGGLKLSFDQKWITLITLSAPLGATLR